MVIPQDMYGKDGRQPCTTRIIIDRAPDLSDRGEELTRSPPHAARRVTRFDGGDRAAGRLPTGRQDRGVNGWLLAYDAFDPVQERLREALCTLGNGYFATRGAAPESPPGRIHYPGTYIAGCYNRLPGADPLTARGVPVRRASCSRAGGMR